ncbi:MAG: response regulator [Alphaproteobacteria bacterium]|jgi:two-component system chemotaxis response regulator CheY|nr:response regulator [Alphaproteobacteria bacterium]MDP6516984.1 response regulator [Alphaproteobacteria bacterium]|tara:strand:+ start:292 stop:534 length:243 start_codon:yes stop_codon:yes gene_type:complete
MRLDEGDVVTAVSGREALDQILDTGSQFTLIVADWNMADISGIDLLKTVRSKGSKVPFIMLTANLTPHHTKLAARYGVDD